MGGILNDTLTGGGGNDQLIGGAGADHFVVDAGTDTMRGLGVGDASQVLAGASVQATLTAAWSADATSGNDGIARLHAVGFSVDLSLAGGALGWNVTNNGQAVAVSLLGSAAGDTLVGGDQAFAWIGGAAFSHDAGQLRLAKGRLQGDVDGDAVADFERTLSGVAMLEVGAIWL